MAWGCQTAFFDVLFGTGGGESLEFSGGVFWGGEEVEGELLEKAICQ